MPNYWGKTEEDLCTEYTSASKHRRDRIATLLYPKVKRMVESICNRYMKFNRAQDYYETLILETITEVYLQLPRFDKKLNKKAYSFLSFVIKHHLIDTLKVDTNYENKYLLVDKFADEIEETQEEEDFNLNRILSHLQTLKKKVVSDYGINDETMSALKFLKKNRLLEIINLSIEFITKFHSYNPRDIYFYIVNNKKVKITDTNLGSNYFPMVFNLMINSKERKSEIDNRYAKNCQIIDVDFTPNLNGGQRHKKRKNKTQYKFF